MKPILQALLIADRIYTDKDTGKKIIAGVFQRLSFITRENFNQQVASEGGNIPIVPAGYDAGSSFAYASLTAIRGEQPLVLRYVNLEDDTVVFQYDFTVRCDDPLQSLEVVLPLPRLPTGKEGTFALEMLYNDEPLGSYRVSVRELMTGTDDDS